MATQGVNSNVQRVLWLSGENESQPFDLRSQTLTGIEWPDALTNTAILFAGSFTADVVAGSPLPPSSNPTGYKEDLDHPFLPILDEAGGVVTISTPGTLPSLMGLDDQLSEVSMWSWVQFTGVAPEGADRVFRVHSKEA